MKWFVVAALLALAVVAYLVLTDTPTPLPAPDTAERPAQEPPASPPMLQTGAPGPQAPRKVPDAPAEEPEPTKPRSARSQEQVAKEKKAKEAAPGRKLRPGETFTPVTALEIPSKEEREAAAKKTRERLQAMKPLRTRWSDTSLQDVLRQLSEQAGMVIALGGNALPRAASIAVSDPFAGAERPADPSMWDLVVALGRREGFLVTPWKKGVLLDAPPDPEVTRVNIFSVRDLTQAEWGGKKEVEAKDRLPAVFPDLIREAAGLKGDAVVRMQGTGVVVVRETRANLERIAEALDAWRGDPKALHAAYKTLIAKRHPTVSGAPPRDGEEPGK